MKALKKALRGQTRIVFLDFEATQLEAEMIALGALKADLYEDGKIKKVHPGISLLIHPKHHVGPVVSQMTGLNDYLLNKKGVKFHDAVNELKKFVGFKPESYIYCFYGSQDARILDVSYNLDTEADLNFLRLIRKNYLDFSTFLSQYISDEHGNPLSLVNMAKLLEVNPKLPAHDPYSDAFNLYQIYDAFTKRTDILAREYKKTLLASHKVPLPIRKLMLKLEEDKEVTLEDFDKYIKEVVE